MIRILLCLVFSLISLQQFAQVNDRFAEIGNKAMAARSNLLVAPAPPMLSNIQLPFAKGSKRIITPMNRLDTPEELQLELQKKRLLFAPFLQNLAPEMNKVRASVSLKNFNWRIETEADKKDFSSVVKGEGKWEKIAIPHYGPPLGKATTYYQTNFEVGASMIKQGAVFIAFKAVDYKSHVFINGSYVGSHEGAFAPFEFDVMAFVRNGTNQLLIKVENDYPMGGHVGDDGKKLDGDKVYAATGPGYDDPELGWHHCPPGMGIWQRVTIEARSTVHIKDIFVRPIGETDTAEVWLEVYNTETSNRGIKIRHALFGQNFKTTVYENAIYTPQTIHIPGVGDLVKPTDWERKDLKMGKETNYLRFRIHIPNCKRWNPDEPWLYQLQVELLDEQNNLADARKQHFGMRSFTMDTISTPKGAMFLNGKFTRLRGANTMGAFIQNVMKENWQQLIDDILLAKIANMNYIRMTQFPVQAEVYDYCDMLGMMTQSDLPLFGVLRRNKWAECIRQTEELERLVRSHPCNIMVSYINERFPNAEGNPQRHLSTYEEFEGFFHAADEAVHLANPDRVIKAGDGDYDPPSPGLPDSHCYNGWYNGHGLGLGEMYKGFWMPVKQGWYYACGEFGSEGLDPLNTMLDFYPKKWLPATSAAEKNWTPNVIAMAQTYRFHYLWMNSQSTMKDWIRESQDHQAWITRLTTESFRRNSNMVSFAIHLFIDAWPAGWMKSIMDVKRQPKKAYFEYAHALAPLAASLRSDRNQFFAGDEMKVAAWIANDKNEVPANAIMQYQWEQAGKVIGGGTTTASIPVNSSRFQGFITSIAPAVLKRTQLTLRLQVLNESGQIFHETDFAVTVFPSPVTTTKMVWIAGGTNGIGAKLAAQLGLKITDDATKATVLLIDSMPAYQQKRQFIEDLVKSGKTAVLLQPDTGSFTIAADSIVVTKTTMGQYYFVSPSLGNQRMNGFKPQDFRWWYNRNNKLISPILAEMSQMKGWTSLLKTGQTGWVGGSDYAYAAAEKNMGKGVFRICHLQLDGRVQDNATAREFAMVLLGLNH